MKNPRDLTGMKFDRLEVLGKSEEHTAPTYKWLCRCACGEVVDVRRGQLVVGSVRSCGCLRREIAATRFRKHFGKGTPEYSTWQNAKDRCSNPNNAHYALYGGRGIKMCDKWAADFTAFLQDVGKRPDGMTSLDRIDPDGDYAPGNCRWATQKQQCNNKRNNVLLTYQGKTANATQWAEELSIPVCNILSRIQRGKPIEVVLHTGKFDTHGKPI